MAKFNTAGRLAPEETLPHPGSDIGIGNDHARLDGKIVESEAFVQPDDPTLPIMLRTVPSEAARPVIIGYEVLQELGRGSMGVVYKARQLSLNRFVALKMIRSVTGITEEALSRFVEEARLVALLQHPNIIQIYEINVTGNIPFFSMELAEEGSLAEQISGRPQPIMRAAQIVDTLARAIQAVHQRGIVHRDLKPSNILLVKSGADTGLRSAAAGLPLPSLQPKITDFGLAKQLSEGGNGTESGMILGTPSYMAPEQAEGRSRDVGPPADVYSLGAILYEMLTGRPPYAGESPLETVLQLFQMEPVAPSRLQPKVPRDLETICLKCLNKEPLKRYADAGALADDLTRFLRGEPIQARPTSLPERLVKWSRRRPALATLAVSICATVFILVGLIFWHQVDLQFSLDQARLDERQARDGQDASSQHERLMVLRENVKDLVRAGEAALVRKDWPDVRVQLLRARDQCADEPELADLRDQIERSLEHTERYRLDRERLQKFHQHRNDAFFHASMFTGSDMASSLEEARRSALAALALFGATPDTQTDPTVESPHFDEQEKMGIRTGCFELLLVLAESVAQTVADRTNADSRRQAEQALLILDRAARLGLDTRAYHHHRAQFLAQAGQDEAAEQERDRAKAHPAVGEFDHFLLGTEQYRQGNWKEAIRSLESVLQLRPDHFWGHYYLALCLLKTQRPDLAAARLTTCLGWRPDLPWLYLLRGSAWAEMNQFVRAEEDFEAALKGTLTEAARYGLYINRGVSRIRQGRTAEAIEDLRCANQIRPQRYQGYVNLAQAFVKDKKLSEAVEQLDQAIQKAPGLALLHRTRARTFLLQQNDAAALIDLKQAISLDAGNASPALAEDYLERGRILHRGKDYEGAVKAYDSAVAIQPRHLQVHRLRAEALLELNQLAEAVQSLDVCVKDGPPHADVFRARAAVRTRLGQYPGAQTDYTRALEIDPDVATFAARGWNYLVAEAPALALSDFTEAIRLDPKRADAYAGRGAARVLLGQYSLGIADAEESLRIGPSSPRLLYNAARTYAQAAARIAADAKRDNRNAGALPNQWQDRAVQLLQEALAMQTPTERIEFWQTYVQNDPALGSIRQKNGYKVLASRHVRSAI